MLSVLDFKFVFPSLPISHPELAAKRVRVGAPGRGKLVGDVSAGRTLIDNSPAVPGSPRVLPAHPTAVSWPGLRRGDGGAAWRAGPAARD